MQSFRGPAVHGLRDVAPRQPFLCLASPNQPRPRPIPTCAQAVRKLADAKKLENTLNYSSEFGDGKSSG